MAEDIAIRPSYVVNGIGSQRHKAGTFPPEETTPGVLGRITCGRGTVPVPGGSGGGTRAVLAPRVGSDAALQTLP